MKMKTIEINLYKFNELSEKSQEKVLNELHDINVDYSWWDFIYEDAKDIGLEITEFDIDRGNYLEGHALLSIHDIVQLIIDNHGKNTDTYKLALDYYKSKRAGCPYAKKDFIYQLRKCYLSILRKEYEYLVSEEAIIETINTNGYDFTENGKLY